MHSNRSKAAPSRAQGQGRPQAVPTGNNSSVGNVNKGTKNPPGSNNVNRGNKNPPGNSPGSHHVNRNGNPQQPQAQGTSKPQAQGTSTNANQVAMVSPQLHPQNQPPAIPPLSQANQQPSAQSGPSSTRTSLSQQQNQQKFTSAIQASKVNNVPNEAPKPGGEDNGENDTKKETNTKENENGNLNSSIGSSGSADSSSSSSSDQDDDSKGTIQSGTGQGKLSKRQSQPFQEHLARASGLGLNIKESFKKIAAIENELDTQLNDFEKLNTNVSGLTTMQSLGGRRSKHKQMTQLRELHRTQGDVNRLQTEVVKEIEDLTFTLRCQNDYIIETTPIKDLTEVLEESRSLQKQLSTKVDRMKQGGQIQQLEGYLKNLEKDINQKKLIQDSDSDSDSDSTVKSDSDSDSVSDSIVSDESPPKKKRSPDGQKGFRKQQSSSKDFGDYRASSSDDDSLDGKKKKKKNRKLERKDLVLQMYGNEKLQIIFFVFSESDLYFPNKMDFPQLSRTFHSRTFTVPRKDGHDDHQHYSSDEEDLHHSMDEELGSYGSTQSQGKGKGNQGNRQRDRRGRKSDKDVDPFAQKFGNLGNATDETLRKYERDHGMTHEKFERDKEDEEEERRKKRRCCILCWGFWLIVLIGQGLIAYFCACRRRVGDEKTPKDGPEETTLTRATRNNSRRQNRRGNGNNRLNEPEPETQEEKAQREKKEKKEEKEKKEKEKKKKKAKITKVDKPEGQKGKPPLLPSRQPEDVKPNKPVKPPRNDQQKQKDFNKLKDVQDQWGISPEMLKDLEQLIDIDVYVIMDDSGSMSAGFYMYFETPSRIIHNQRKHFVLLVLQGEKSSFFKFGEKVGGVSQNTCETGGSFFGWGDDEASRWQEQMRLLDDIGEMLQYLDPDGYTLTFLNDSRHNQSNIHSNPLVINKQELQQDPNQPHRKISSPKLKEYGPSGGTPLVETFHAVTSYQRDLDQQELQRNGNDKSKLRKKLFIVFTDGFPSSGSIADIRGMINDPIYFPENFYQQFQLTIDESDSSFSPTLVDVYNCCIDGATERTDVVDDYISEQKEVVKAGRMQKGDFTQMTYLAKVLLGPLNPKYGEMDGQTTGSSSCDCEQMENVEGFRFRQKKYVKKRQITFVLANTKQI